MISWHRFPTEIRLSILEILLRDGCCLFTFAPVSREWQTIIERHTFSRLKLTSSRVTDFASIVHRNRHLVRCGPPDPELWGLSYADNYMITTPFQSLFSALSVWEPGNNSLLLDISVQSPSDSEHCFKYLTFGPDDPSDMCWRDQSAKQSMLVKSTTNDDHEWVDGIRKSKPDSFAIEKVFEEIMGEGPFDSEEEEGEWWQQLPLAPAITRVLLRQQTRRRWKPAALAHMFSRLPGLQDIHYEPWREWVSDQQLWTDRYFQRLFESLSSNPLRKLILFENFDQSYPASYTNLGYEPLDDMLREAAKAATEMPNLETMEVWNREKGLAMLFRYQRANLGQEQGQDAVITCRGTWELSLRAPVAQAWDAVALRHGGQGCVVVKEVLDDGVCVMSHGDAIGLLKLSRPVVRPVSLRQIKMEHLI
ncbi:hypothetical protein IFR05_001398 [Cadophora sp. M221]|nr:hypothetical protein IFR05_001398 [Cadophora sp. M221]